ncbi:hypothetical protein RhiirA4_427302 [Rhizophagus irregularis]|uniref:Amine oxidase domain-containing protein n=1 Tax=Rhizophagus irregularis TaxID=588596 RepID=A0A2I1H8G8_9GLOM|nr:hypothetical protein RhiirA4_427302 [Rhizophagus irregularis]
MENNRKWNGQLIGSENIFTGAEVYKIEDVSDGVNFYHSESSAPVKFDKVLMALPPAALRIIETPTWSPDKMHAIRALHFEPLYKIGLRFKTRLWEKERICLGLRDLKKVYGDQVDIDDQDIQLTGQMKNQQETPCFFPGQFHTLFNIARAPEGNDYFAGEYLSVHHT